MPSFAHYTGKVLLMVSVEGKKSHHVYVDDIITPEQNLLTFSAFQAFLGIIFHTCTSSLPSKISASDWIATPHPAFRLHSRWLRVDSWLLAVEWVGEGCLKR